MRRERASLPPRLRQALLAQHQELSWVERELQEAGAPAAPRTLMVAAAEAGEGCTTAALALAFSLATFAARPTLLIDANPLAPELHRRLGVAAGPGLVELLQGGIAPEEALLAITGESEAAPLGLLTFGAPERPVPPSLWEGPRLEALISHLLGTHHYLVLDAPPLLASPHAQALVRHADAVVLVLEHGVTRLEQAELAMDTVRRAGGEVLGALFNRYPVHVAATFRGELT